MSTHRPASVVSLRPTPRILLAGLVGGAATASGVALTATSGWLIVRASEMPVILTLLVAVVAVRAFGIARPVLRYAERLLSHDEALADLARRRSRMYAALVPLTPARLGRRSRSSLLAGVVDDITDVVDAHVRVTVPVVSGVVAGVLGVALAVFCAVMLATLVSRMQFRSVSRLYLGELEESGAKSGARSKDEIDLSAGGQGVVGSEIEIIQSRTLVAKAISDSVP